MKICGWKYTRIGVLGREESGKFMDMWMEILQGYWVGRRVGNGHFDPLWLAVSNFPEFQYFPFK